ncbi:ATP-binding cassette domain-containing protein [Gorillibacterium timonense]|uniref:ATP-binding cassette domain-containing protein n=1 Tax=Gorillibacterium timonense TaxID=1689269 RepID=UPI00071D014F|nr:AAA family ATPase [Gorillibacterium timonense]
MLTLENLIFRYPKATANTLDHVTLPLCEKKVNVLLGMNGAGKTTLFDLITGVLPSKRTYLNVTTEQIVYQTQGTYISPVIRASDFVRLICGIGGLTIAKQPEGLDHYSALEPVEQKLISKIWKMKLGALSVGERRWLFVTAVGWLDREMYIFDEPTTAVDPSSRIKIMRRMDSLVKQSKLVLISTHQLHELQDIDCLISLLHEGKIIFHGSYDQFLNQGGSDSPDRAFEAFITC